MSVGALRLRLVGIAALAAFGVVTAVSAAGPATIASSQGSRALVTVKSTKNGALGKILVNATGRTLYHFASEKKKLVKCTASCAAMWPPLLIGKGKQPIAAPGVTARLLGTIQRPDGRIQVTYRGFALYLYSGDKRAGDVKGQGKGGLWHAIAAPSGSVVMKVAKTPTVPTTPKSGSTAGSGSTASGSGSTGSGSTGSGSGSSGSGSGTTGSGSGLPPECDTDLGANGCM